MGSNLGSATEMCGGGSVKPLLKYFVDLENPIAVTISQILAIVLFCFYFLVYKYNNSPSPSSQTPYKHLNVRTLGERPKLQRL